MVEAAGQTKEPVAPSRSAYRTWYENRAQRPIRSGRDRTGISHSWNSPEPAIPHWQ